ncbi:hypothetical protein BCR43DRAFT_382191 [Syncephalastrum racemosum]|uniref:Uncharacterized protein n=1 Tax=Syncephalastrum racemosum TaxID=13706 RepID=A0A1X2H5I1_SYNRA|nr:hypothetical protein BCR43DRAFT_382191 [Syncephalastrum racemosum]
MTQRQITKKQLLLEKTRFVEAVIEVLHGHLPQLKQIIGPIVGTCLSSLGVQAIIRLIGFGALGPVGGSLAALWQSYLGDVPARSIFSILQSIGMTGSLGRFSISFGAAWAAM